MCQEKGPLPCCKRRTRHTYAPQPPLPRHREPCDLPREPYNIPHESYARRLCPRSLNNAPIPAANFTNKHGPALSSRVGLGNSRAVGAPAGPAVRGQLGVFNVCVQSSGVRPCGTCQSKYPPISTDYHVAVIVVRTRMAATYVGQRPGLIEAPKDLLKVRRGHYFRRHQPIASRFLQPGVSNSE